MALFWILVGGVVGSAVLAFVGSLVLQVAARLVIRETFEPGRAYTTVFICSVVMVLIGMLLGVAFSEPLRNEADEARTEALRGYDTWHFSGEPEAKGPDAVLGWGSTRPWHVRLQVLGMALSAAAWIGILRWRHRVDVLCGLLIVLLTQVIWAGVLGVLWGLWLGVRALTG